MPTSPPNSFSFRPREHLRCGDKADGIAWILARDRALRRSKEEQSVWNNRPTDRPAKLVAFQRVAFGRKVISSIEGVVPKEFKRASVPFIAARLCDDIDHATGLRSVVRWKRTGFDFEFAHGIRKRQRQPDIRHRIQVVSAVDEIKRLTAL